MLLRLINCRFIIIIIIIITTTTTTTTINSSSRLDVRLWCWCNSVRFLFVLISLSPCKKVGYPCMACQKIYNVTRLSVCHCTSVGRLTYVLSYFNGVIIHWNIWSKCSPGTLKAYLCNSFKSEFLFFALKGVMNDSVECKMALSMQRSQESFYGKLSASLFYCL